METNVTQVNGCKHRNTLCPVCTEGVILKAGGVDFCSCCGTVLKTVEAKHVETNVTQFDKAEALDRIHVIQTMLAELLFRNDYAPHKGLSTQAGYLVGVVNEKLYEAYQFQSEWVFEEEK